MLKIKKRKQKTSRYERIIFFCFDLYLEKLMAATTTPRKYQNQIKEEATGRIRIKTKQNFLFTLYTFHN